MKEAFYEEYSEIDLSHWWFVGRSRIIQTVLDAELGPSNGQPERRILDMGCGTGGMLEPLRRFGEVEGVDASESAVRLCHERGEMAVTHLTSAELPFPDDSFDVLTALDVIEHISDDVAAVSEVRRVLRPGGIFLATVPAHPALWGAQDEISHHFRRYTARTLHRTLAGAGLRERRTTYFNSILFGPIAAIRLARRILPEPKELRSDFEMTDDGPVNRALTKVFASEARWLARRDLPFGVSLLVVAEPMS